MNSSYTKITTWIILAALCFIGYDGIVRPYISAYSETEQILNQAGIPKEKKANDAYRERALTALKENCTTGLYKESDYEFHCIVNSPVPYWINQFLTRIDTYEDTEKAIKE